MAQHPFVIVGSPEYNIAQRAARIAAGGGPTGRTSGFVITYREWADCFGFTKRSKGDFPCTCCAMKTPASSQRDLGAQEHARRALKSRIAKHQRDWNGQVFYIGHSQGAANVFVGGYTNFKENPNFMHRVSGGAYAEFLNDVLPDTKPPKVHLVLLACWLGDASLEHSRGFLKQLLVGLDAPRSRVFAHATQFETWYSNFDHVSVNGVRRAGFSAYNDFGLAGLHALAFMTDFNPEPVDGTPPDPTRVAHRGDGGILKGMFDPRVDAAYRMTAEDKKAGAKSVAEAQFATLADVLSREFPAGGGRKEKVFTTFYWDGAQNGLVRDRSNEVAWKKGSGPRAGMTEFYDD